MLRLTGMFLWWMLLVASTTLVEALFEDVPQWHMILLVVG